MYDTHADEDLEMAFSESHIGVVLKVFICKYCIKKLVMPYIITNYLQYQTYQNIICQHDWTRSAYYNHYKEGNDTNYNIIQASRTKIIDNYRQIIPQFILPDVAQIIIEYCQFARHIVFVPTDKI
jgi:hypothetical protein